MKLVQDYSLTMYVLYLFQDYPYDKGRRQDETRLNRHTKGGYGEDRTTDATAQVYQESLGCWTAA